APQDRRAEAQRHLQPPARHVPQHGDVTAQARADHHDPAQSQGTAPLRRADHHARQAGRAPRPAAGLRPDHGREGGGQALHHHRRPLPRPPRRLLPRAEGRHALWRRGADGGDRTRGPRPGRQGPRQRAEAGAGRGGSGRRRSGV
ncbi:MAG: LSU ribosomal protein L17p, partial [uncultured Acetobacteraceae bacterium]